MLGATGWTSSAWRTYRSKQLRNVAKGPAAGPYAVAPAFRRVPIQQFLANFTQERQLISTYERFVYGDVVEYEFLLPLSRENELQQTLDELFYSDALEETARQIDVTVLAGMVGRRADESDEELRSRVCREVGTRFVGYSSVHVAGRFRSGELQSRSAASELGKAGFRYLIDETTALVRFLVPLEASKRDFREDPLSVPAALGHLHAARTASGGALEAEIDLIRALFFLFFVEAVVETVRGEEEIWLLENSPAGHHVFVWKREG